MPFVVEAVLWTTVAVLGVFVMYMLGGACCEQTTLALGGPQLHYLTIHLI
jgi:hypothetical protein